MKDFNTFDEVTNPVLRTWNRCNTMFNLRNTGGEKAAKEYAEQLTKGAQKQMFLMFNQIARKGYEEVKKEVNRAL